MGFKAPFCARLPRFLDSSVDRAQRIMGSTALVMGLIVVAASDQFDLGLTIGCVKTVE